MLMEQDLCSWKYMFVCRSKGFSTNDSLKINYGSDSCKAQCPSISTHNQFSDIKDVPFMEEELKWVPWYSLSHSIHSWGIKFNSKVYSFIDMPQWIQGGAVRSFKGTIRYLKGNTVRALWKKITIGLECHGKRKFRNDCYMQIRSLCSKTAWVPLWNIGFHH